MAELFDRRLNQPTRESPPKESSDEDVGNAPAVPRAVAGRYYPNSSYKGPRAIYATGLILPPGLP
jgi:hypothetical protein